MVTQLHHAQPQLKPSKSADQLQVEPRRRQLGAYGVDGEGRNIGQMSGTWEEVVVCMGEVEEEQDGVKEGDELDGETTPKEAAKQNGRYCLICLLHDRRVENSAKS